ncbi:MAG: MFS transporter [Lachnospiraceae bacterium]|nr:MFS transporter [Lachnospiraceae bacterium]
MGNQNPAKETKKKGLSTAFTWFHATSVNGTAMAIAATIASYFSLYVQNEIGITAAQLAVILFICSLWDAINDPIMGVVCDSINPRWGRYRTWFTFTPIFLLVDMFLLFSNPGFIQGSTMAKCVYVCVSYMFYGMIVTAYTMPQMAILPAMTLDDAERNSVVSKGAAVCALAFTVASTFSTQLVEIFGSYRNLMCFYAVFAIVSFWGLYKTSEERYVMPKDPNAGGLKQLVYVFRHKEIWPVMLTWCLASISYGFMFTASVYYASYVLLPKRVDLATMDEATLGATIGSTISVYMGFISVGALISMMVLMPIFLRKFKTGYQALIVSQILTIICYVILLFTGTANFYYCCVVSFIATAVGSMVNALVNVLVNDTIDFILLKEGKQLNGIVSSVKGFAQKCGTTITSSGVLAIIAIGGFSTDYGYFDQPASATTAVIISRFAIPAVVSAIILIVMLFYPLKKYFPEIAAMKEKMRAEQGE